MLVPSGSGQDDVENASPVASPTRCRWHATRMPGLQRDPYRRSVGDMEQTYGCRYSMADRVPARCPILNTWYDLRTGCCNRPVSCSNDGVGAAMSAIFG